MFCVLALRQSKPEVNGRPVSTFVVASAVLRRPLVEEPATATGTGVDAGVRTVAVAEGADMLAETASTFATFTGWLR